MQFSSLGLCDNILKAISEKGYDSPSPIQALAIPAILKKQDVMAAAQTGTGKTAGFTLPILQQLQNSKPAGPNKTKVLILTPTRELAAQVADNITFYSKHLNVRTEVVFGGVKINPQMIRLRKGVEILVATPGRLLDLYEQNAISFKDLETFVLDEADRMLFMGFIKDVQKIINLLPKSRQNLMFSATFSEDIRRLAKGLMNKPEELSVSPANATANSVQQFLYEIDHSNKTKLLIELIKKNKWQQVLVFAKTKHGANRIATKLENKKISALAIHGNKSQSARTKALASFKSKDIKVLVATDIAARGLDISQLPLVINFDLPQVAEDYVHRIGRTGRAGNEGLAISLASVQDFENLTKVEQLIQKHIPRKQFDGFEVSEPVPVAKAIKPPKKKKPKKNKKPLLEINEKASSKGSQTDSLPKTRDKNNGGTNHKSNSSTTSKKRPKNRKRKPSEQKYGAKS